MSIKKSIPAYMIVAILVMPVAVGAGEKQWKLPSVVQKYPDTQRVEQLSREKLSMYTDDDAEKVTNFYRKTLNMDTVGEGKFLVGKNVRKLDGPSHMDYDVWLKVRRIKHQVVKKKGLFGFLQKEIMVKRIHTEQELKQAQQKYAHLAKAWYPDFDVKGKLNSCEEATRSKVTAAEKKISKRDRGSEQEMMAQIQALMAQGRYQEAGALAKKSARPGMEASQAGMEENKTDHWDEYIACLDEVDKHDYRTRIDVDLVIEHFKPSTEASRKARTAEKDGQKQTSNSSDEKPNSEKSMVPDMDDLKKMFSF